MAKQVRIHVCMWAAGIVTNLHSWAATGNLGCCLQAQVKALHEDSFFSGLLHGMPALHRTHNDDSVLYIELVLIVSILGSGISSATVVSTTESSPNPKWVADRGAAMLHAAATHMLLSPKKILNGLSVCECVRHHVKLCKFVRFGKHEGRNKLMPPAGICLSVSIIVCGMQTKAGQGPCRAGLVQNMLLLLLPLLGIPGSNQLTTPSTVPPRPHRRHQSLLQFTCARGFVPFARAAHIPVQ
eukprot:scaffold56456_cov17-Tisochrysis_lutea.AAC.1